ncbi:hypothetical protein V8D89_006714 [Ganoderma adspersum]
MSPPTPLWQLLAPTTEDSLQKRPSPRSFDAVHPRVMSEKTYTDPNRWARFKWYARFVQDLNVMNSDTGREHKRLIHALIAHNDGQSIFPSLQSLWWPPLSFSDTSYFPLLTPQLHSMLFDFYQCTERDGQPPDEDPQGHLFLAGLRATSPRLGQLSVCTSLQRFGKNHSRVIASFEHLTDLHLVAHIKLASFLELVAMPRMEILRVAHVRSDEPELSHPPHRIRASRLTLISVGGNCPSLTQIFSALDAPQLVSASLQVICDDPHTDEPVDYASCIEALASAAPLTTMGDICIKLDEDGCGSQALEHLGDLLVPLMQFHSLTRFSLSCPTVRLVGNRGDFLSIAHAWPKLQAFELWPAYWATRVDPDDEYSEPIPIPTPEVLECFRDQCPALEELSLPYLDFDADVPARRVPRDGPCHGLELVAFGAKDVRGEHDDDCWDLELDERDDSKATEWARYVLDLFPHLDTNESLSQCHSMVAAPVWVEVFRRVDDLPRSEF